MARGRLISLWRRCSQLTTGVSTAARKREMTNQPTKVRTCQSRNKVPSTTAALKRATTTVRITWLGEMRTHNASARDGGVRLRRSTLRFRLAFCPRVCLRLLLRVLLRTHTQLLPFSRACLASLALSATKISYCRSTRPRDPHTQVGGEVGKPYQYGHQGYE